MARQPNAMMVDLLNKCDMGHKVMLHCVPTRVIRVVQTDADGCAFRVEQLVEHSGFSSLTPRGAWTSLSMHSNKQPGAAFSVALDHAWKAQSSLIAKLKKKYMGENTPQILGQRT